MRRSWTASGEYQSSSSTLSSTSLDAARAAAVSTSPKNSDPSKVSTWCGRSPSARRTASRSGSKPCAASTSSTSAPRCRATCRRAKSSISGRLVASRALTGGSAMWRTPARVASAERHASVEWWSKAARRTARLCSSRRSASSRSTSASSAAATGGATSTTPSVTTGTPDMARASRSAVGVSGVRRTPWNPRAASMTSSVTGPVPDPWSSRERSTTGWSQSLRKPIGLKTRSSTGSGPGSVTTVGARSMTWCSATSPLRRATTTSGGTSRSGSPAPATSGSSTLRASRPGAAGRPAYATTTPPCVVSPGPAACRAISITTSWARAPEANRTTVRTPRSPAGRAARCARGGHSGRGTSTQGVGASVSQQATALHCPRRGTALAIRRRRDAVAGHHEHRAPALERPGDRRQRDDPRLEALDVLDAVERVERDAVGVVDEHERRTGHPEVVEGVQAPGPGQWGSRPHPLPQRGGQRVLHERAGLAPEPVAADVVDDVDSFGGGHLDEPAERLGVAVADRLVDLELPQLAVEPGVGEVDARRAASGRTRRRRATSPRRRVPAAARSARRPAGTRAAPSRRPSRR